MSTGNPSIELLILKQAIKKNLTAEEIEQLTAWCQSHPYHSDLPEYRESNWVIQQLEEEDRYPIDQVWGTVKARMK